MLKLLVLYRYLKENFATPGGYFSLLPHFVGFRALQAILG